MMRRIPRMIAFSALLTMFGTAHADDPGPDAAPPESGFSVGLMAGITPRYVGSREFHAQILPYASGHITTQAGLFALEGDGFSWTPFMTDSFEVSLILGHDGGRKEKNGGMLSQGSDHLKGMGEIKSTAESGIRGIWRLGSVSLHAKILRGLGHQGHAGTHGEFGSSYEHAFSNRLGGSIGLAAQWGDRAYNRAYFGVTPEQSARTAFKTHDPGAGISSVDLSSGLRYQFDAHYAVQGAAILSQLVGKAAKSPIVQRRTGFTTMAGVTYTF